ncbi:hypothetical protein [Corynebacterium propinquum]|uniref:hypothetical protein n=1 Tax=Corynebacterium propinquum TaxID=43769 RepID=UPI0025419FE5|nr:hypothetical protein [Corynebacterium propinquum]MDK4235734.1 hypothetical protein [Corynebacterium propinquum]MDK4252742.1 hypothetical protein [Corynebacterium propinquum]MDK4282930.1 hypothetical protein [Corynebacterium propinquum]
MAIVFDAFENYEIELPKTKGTGTVTISFPPADCLAPDDVEALNKKFEVLNDDASVPDRLKPKYAPLEAIREMLLHFNTSKTAQETIKGMVQRHLKKIDELWAKDMEELTGGKSKDSAGSSSEKTSSKA